MKQNRLILNVISFIFLILFISSCNSISLKNVRNDFKWKNKKFNSKVNIQMIYQPVILNEITSVQPKFYNQSDTVNIDSTYRIEQLLVEKFNNRNMVFDAKAKITILIDTLLFSERSKGVSVYKGDEQRTYIGETQKDFFQFEIIGHIADSLNNSERIKAYTRHETRPRESTVLNGVMAKGGIGAEADIMIENAINEFSFKVYKELQK